MSVAHFNLKIGTIMMLMFLFVLLCGNSFYRTFLHLKWFASSRKNLWIKRSIQIVLCTVVLVGGITSFASGKERSVVELVNIQSKGHWAYQLCDDYSIDAVDEGGTQHYYTTVIFGNKNISSVIETLNVGDRCIVKANRWGTIYHIELIE